MPLELNCSEHVHDIFTSIFVRDRERPLSSMASFSLINVGVRALSRTYGRHRSPIQALPSSLLPISQWRSFSNILRCPISITKSHQYDSPYGLVQQRSVVISKRTGKRKTVKAVAKRFTRTGSGKLKYWKSGGNHKMYRKSKRSKRELSKPCYATKTQLRTLNRMLSGW